MTIYYGYSYSVYYRLSSLDEYLYTIAILYSVYYRLSSQDDYLPLLFILSLLTVIPSYEHLPSLCINLGYEPYG